MNRRLNSPRTKLGRSWSPPAYNPTTGYYTVCAQYVLTAKEVTNKLELFEEGKGYSGNAGALIGSNNNGPDTPGYITTYNMHTGKIVWSDKLEHLCYDGAVATDGGVVFVPDWEGDLVAYNAATGAKLWTFAMGAGGSPPAAFEWDGKEYIVDYAGGNDLGDQVHGDNLWLFSLNGTGPGPIALGKTPAPEHTIGE